MVAGLCNHSRAFWTNRQNVLGKIECRTQRLWPLMREMIWLPTPAGSPDTKAPGVPGRGARQVTRFLWSWNTCRSNKDVPHPQELVHSNCRKLHPGQHLHQ